MNEPAQRLVVSTQEHQTHHNRAIVWVMGLVCLIAGSIGGYFFHQHRENAKQYSRYAAELEPLLYYKERVHAAKDRGSNSLMRVVNYKLYQADLDGLDIEKLLVLAQPRDKQPPVLIELNRARFLDNLRTAKEYGIFEGAENMKRIAAGNSPYVTKGKYSGEKIEVEHLIPKSIAPSLDNILSNLMWLPKSLNASKSNKVTPEALKPMSSILSWGFCRRKNIRSWFKLSCRTDRTDLFAKSLATSERIAQPVSVLRNQ